MSMAHMKEMVRLGDLIEIVLSGEGLTVALWGGGTAVINREQPSDGLRAAEACGYSRSRSKNPVLTSDLGQPGRVTHADSFQIALAVLVKAGFSQAEIDLMTKRNPARFLGLE